jgi:hypothetical protein
MQTVPITPIIANSKTVHGELYSIQHLLCDKVCQWLATGQWFSPGTPISSTNKTDCYDITEILLKVALNTINQQTNLQRMLLTIEHRLYEIESILHVLWGKIKMSFFFWECNKSSIVEKHWLLLQSDKKSSSNDRQ